MKGRDFIGRAITVGQSNGKGISRIIELDVAEAEMRIAAEEG